MVKKKNKQVCVGGGQKIFHSKSYLLKWVYIYKKENEKIAVLLLAGWKCAFSIKYMFTNERWFKMEACVPSYFEKGLKNLKIQ